VTPCVHWYYLVQHNDIGNNGTIHNDDQHNNIQNRNTQHSNKNCVALRLTILNVEWCYAGCHYEKCRYSESCGAKKESLELMSQFRATLSQRCPQPNVIKL